MNKYELTTETLQYAGHTLHRIKALRDFGSVKAGELGGWIEKEGNLSQGGNAWVHDNAKVYGDARVFGDAIVRDYAKVYGEAKVCDNAKVRDNAWVFDNVWLFDQVEVFDYAVVQDKASVRDNARIFGNVWVRDKAEIGGNAKVCDNADYIVFKNFWSSGRYFTWTRSNNKWSVGCFYGTGEELIKKAYADSDTSGREYERVVRYVESILADEKKEKSDKPSCKGYKKQVI